MPAVLVSLALSAKAVFVFMTLNHCVKAVFLDMPTREVKSAGREGPQLTMRASKLALHCRQAAFAAVSWPPLAPSTPPSALPPASLD